MVLARFPVTLAEGLGRGLGLVKAAGRMWVWGPLLMGGGAGKGREDE